MKANRTLLLAGVVALFVGAALAFAALVSHTSRVFAVDHLAGTEHADLMLELSAATPGERWLLTVGALLATAGVALLLAVWLRWWTIRRQGSVSTASR